MKSDTGQILKSGWGVFLLVSLVLSVAIDLSMLEAELAGGMRRPLFGNGSALLGWIASVIIFVLPPSLLRHFRVSPFSGWLAFGFLLLGYVVWFSITSEPSRTTPKPPSLLLIGGLALGWRLLTAPRLAIAVVESKVNEPAPTVMLSDPKDEHEVEERKVVTATPDEIPPLIQTGSRAMASSGHKKLRLILAGLLLILMAFGIHALVEDESPSLTWLIIGGGIWCISAYLTPDAWIHSIGGKLNFQTLKRGFHFIGLTVLGLVAIGLLIAGATVAVQLMQEKASQATNKNGSTEKGRLIEETDALGVWNAFETMDEATKPRAAKLLDAYRTQQASAGLPLWPSIEKRKTERRERVKTVFDNPLVLDADDGTFAAADEVQQGAGDKMRKREANILFLADRYQADEMDVRQRYDFYKADMGAKWGTGTLDDEAFFRKAKAELEAEQSKPLEK
jgi:hypothetical protein